MEARVAIAAPIIPIRGTKMKFNTIVIKAEIKVIVLNILVFLKNKKKLDLNLYKL